MTSSSILYRQCSKCVMDTTDPIITFNDEGICNHCLEYDKIAYAIVKKGKDGEEHLKKMVEEIKASSKGAKYDSIMGLSGGVDSSYLCYIAKNLGLNPLVVHLDNGWNSELAVMNVKNIVSKLNLDLHTYVVNWEEFRDVQLAYIKASVIDIEAITDHAILGTLFRTAKKYGIKNILSGTNFVTEAVLPKSWIFNKADHINLKAIHKRYGTIPLKSFPLYDTRLKKYVHNILRIKTYSPLNYLEYNKDKVKNFLIEELDWRDYGGKHYESIFTRFYQGYILPTKFNVDKRKAHISTLVCSGQITRDEALKQLNEPKYDAKLLNNDKQFVIKKLGLTEDEFESYMNLPVKSHYDFPIEKPLHERFPVLKPLRYMLDLFK